MLAYLFYQTECERRDDLPLLQRYGPFYDDDEFPAFSDFERELIEIGIGIIEHLITPQYLAQLRQNFLAKRRVEFGSALRLS